MASNGIHLTVSDKGVNKEDRNKNPFANQKRTKREKGNSILQPPVYDRCLAMNHRRFAIIKKISINKN